MSQLQIPALDLIPPGEGGKNYHCRDCGQEHTRITALIDATCPKWALVPWAERVGMMAGIEAAAEGKVSLEAVKTYAKENKMTADDAKNEGAARGAAAHAFLEEFIREGEVPDINNYKTQHHPYLRNLARFLLDYEPEFLASEFYVAHHKLDYAGRGDGICKIGKQPPRRNKPFDLTDKTVLFDLKTNREGRVYAPAHLYQVAGYELALRDMGGEATDHQIIVAVGEENYQVLVSYFKPEAFETLVHFYNDQRKQMKQNPNGRKS